MDAQGLGGCWDDLRVGLLAPSVHRAPLNTKLAQHSFNLVGPGGEYAAPTMNNSNNNHEGGQMLN